MGVERREWGLCLTWPASVGQHPWGQGGSEISVLPKAVVNPLSVCRASSGLFHAILLSLAGLGLGKLDSGVSQPLPASPGSYVFLQGPELMCSSLGMLGLCSPSGIKAAWPLGRGVVGLASRLQAGSVPLFPGPAVASPSFSSLASALFVLCLSPREGCGLAGALRRAWRQHPGLAGPLWGPCRLPSAKLVPLLPARLRQGLEGHSGRPSVMFLLPW